MKATYNWLKDFVKIDTPPEKLAEKLTMAGLEVTALEKKAGDCVFEFEVTSNRPDCLSVAGIAREAAAITNSRFKIQNSKLQCKIKNVKKEAAELKIEIENKKDCPLYTAKIIRGIKVCPSPDWLRKRLELIGCRSINNIVDITNYVLFERGQPLHAFDLDKLLGGSADAGGRGLNVVVRRARKGEEITTIDGARIILGEDILLIASGGDETTGKPIAIAGIMGGKDTEVTEKTKNVLLEAAVFNPLTVRHGRQRLGLQSDSAYRFERGVDFCAVEAASIYAAGLISRLAEGEFSAAKGAGGVNLKPKSVSLSLEATNKILGAKIAPARVKKILTGLGFKAAATGKGGLRVAVPSHRQDIRSEIDLIEEVARIYGFAEIAPTMPLFLPRPFSDQKRAGVSRVKTILTGLGLNEVITYSLIDKESLKGFMPAAETEPIEVLNPLSREQEILRPHIVPALAGRIASNLNYQQEYVNIFEVAKIFSASLSGPKEELALAIALCGTKTRLLEEGSIKEKFGLRHLKGIIEVLFERLGIGGCAFSAEKNTPSIDISCGRGKAGRIFILRREFLEGLGIKHQEVVAAELSLDRLLEQARPQRAFIPPPRYPGISRDVSLVLSEEIPVEKLLEKAREAGRPLLCGIKVVDLYRGSQIPAGNIGLTISCLYRSGERTLSDAEVAPLHSLLCKLFEESFGARAR